MASPQVDVVIGVDVEDAAPWWVDFCRRNCPDADCLAEGVCQEPDLDDFTWDESACRPPRRRPVETVAVAGDVL